MRLGKKSWLDEPETEPVDFAEIAERPKVESIYEDEWREDIAEADLPPANPGAPPVIIQPRKASGWSTYPVHLEAGKSQQVLGQLLSRTSAIIRNVSAVEVEVSVGPDNTVSGGVHWPVPVGGQMKLDNTGEAWAVAPAAAKLIVLIEFEKEQGGA